VIQYMRNSTFRTIAEASLRTFINDGPLIDNANWVNRALRSGGSEGKAEDEEGQEVQKATTRN